MAPTVPSRVRGEALSGGARTDTDRVLYPWTEEDTGAHGNAGLRVRPPPADLSDLIRVMPAKEEGLLWHTCARVAAPR